MDIRTILMDHGIGEAKPSIEVDFDNLTEQINELDQYIQTAFRDGIVTEVEARKIQMYINLLTEANGRLSERYQQLISNEYLVKGPIRDELVAAKAKYEEQYYNLMAAINYAIGDGVATKAESEQVDLAYLALSDATKRLEAAFEMSSNAILNKRSNVAEENAIIYSNSIKEELKKDTDSIAQRLKATEGYIDGSFKDGLISAYEVANIQSYLYTLSLQKTQLDNRYDQTIDNYFLRGVPKTNLIDAKTKYDAKYDGLITAINDAIADQVATPEEANRVRQGFVDLDTALALLITCFEKAIDSYSQERADEAERLAREFASSVAGDKAEQARKAAEEFAAKEAEAVRLASEAYADGMISAEEERAIADAQSKMEEAKKFAEEKAEEARKAAEEFAESKLGEAGQATTVVTDAQMYLQKVMNQAYMDNVITPEEQAEIDEAQAALDKARGYADTLTKDAILAAQMFSEKQAKEAQEAAQKFAAQEAELKRLEANAYADGVVTAEEERAIADAQNKLKEAKSHAEKEASEAEHASKLFAEAEAQAAKLYADNQLDAVFRNGTLSTNLEARV